MKRILHSIIIILLAFLNTSCLYLISNWIEEDVFRAPVSQKAIVRIHSEDFNLYVEFYLVGPKYQKICYEPMCVIKHAHGDYYYHHPCLVEEEIWYLLYTDKPTYKVLYVRDDTSPVCLYDINEAYCERFLDDLYDESYIRIFDESGNLLKEWRKEDRYIDSKSPFNSDDYDYKGSYDDYFWTFYVTENMLDRNE